MTQATTHRLRKVPLFASLDDGGLEAVAAIANEFEAAEGHVLMERGQPGTGIFVIEEGSVRVDRPGEEGLVLGPGEFFGELAVLADTPRTARVCVVEDLRGLAIRRNDLTDLLHREPAIAVAMLCELARRLATEA